MKTRTMWALLAMVSSGCGEGYSCLTYAVDGLAVSVSNASNGQPICDATVTATEGAYSEQLFGWACGFTGAAERPGTYVVRATRPGFVPNEVAPVRVFKSGGKCPHVREVRVTIELTPDRPAAAR